MTDAEKAPPHPRRWLTWGSIALLVLVVGGGVGWAAATVLTPPKDVLSSTKYTFVKVVSGEVGSSINLNTVAEWTPVPVGSNLAVGTVTTINVSQGQEVSVGSVLYSVNLRPVVIAQGDVPAFESLAEGSTGADVTQLQAMLTALGFYSGAVDGGFGYRTESAVKAWQESLGLEGDGVVQAGDIVFVPTLPTRVALDTDKVTRGAILSGGEPVVRGLPASPGFTVPVTDSQAGLMPTGTRVEISSPSGLKWEGFVVDQTTDKDNAISVVLSGKDGASICGDGCGEIPVTEQSFLHSQIITAETVKGLTVPSAALLSGADGTLSVIDSKGTQHTVTVVASARGMSVIDGVTEGTLVRVPASEDPGQ
ncbi:MAG: peptidoglycan-binding domain-containing protein [Rhodoglobus sp.]